MGQVKLAPRLSAARFAALREREITTVLVERYHGPLPDDDAGRDDLRLLLAHAAHRKDRSARVADTIATWAPWLGGDERTEFADEALRGPPPFYTSDELGQRLGITMAERSRLGRRKDRNGILRICALSTIGAVDASAEERKRLRLEKRAKAERRRRQELKEQQQRSDAIAEYRGRGAAVRHVLIGRGWISVAELAAVVGAWAAFEDLKPAALRKAIVRELKPPSGHRPRWLRANEELAIENVAPAGSALKVWRVRLIERAA